MMQPKKTFYRRTLPSPPAVAFASKEGKQLFREALQTGYMEGYFVLAEQFRTQDEPAFCGLSTLTMVLNTLAVDPKRVWKGPWRWYNESMLDCCRSLDEIKTEGIEFDQFACLGRCNSLNMIAKRPNQRHVYPTKDSKEPLIEEQIDDDTDEIKSNDDDNNNNNMSKHEYFGLDEFRSDVMISCISSADPIVIVSYSRKGLNQTGDGHFSPIAGYHKEKDMMLIMDVARFKYPPHWVKTEILYNAMCRIDKSCNKTRGWIIASCAEITKSYFFTFNTCEINENNVIDLNDNIICCSSRFIDASCKCSNDNDNDNDNDFTAIKVIKCLLECLPNPLDKYIVNQTERFGIEMDEQHQVIKTKLMNGIKNSGIHDIVLKIFNDKENNKDLINKFGKCQIEIISLMILIIGNNDIWNKLSDNKVSNELNELTKIDEYKYPELDHEILALQYQIKNLREFLISIYSQTIEKLGHCCKH